MGYSIKLNQFEGPLDLLLHLIAKAEISIEEIFVSEVTEQYLKYIEEMKEEDMDLMSDFLSMASTLLYIKSRSLLPVSRPLEEDEVDPEQELIEKLKIYKAYKDACGKLRELEENAENIYFKLPEEMPDLISPVKWEDTEVDLLYAAYLKLLKEKKEKVNLFDKVSVKKDTFSIRLQSEKIMNLVKNNKKVSFFDVFSEDHQPLEIAVTFVALLQLWHDRKISVMQNSQFEEIFISGFKED